MNIAFAILSFFAAVFLPGAIFYRILIKKEFHLSLFLSISFIGSLCFNFVLIYVLVGIGAYTQQ